MFKSTDWHFYFCCCNSDLSVSIKVMLLLLPTNKQTPSFYRQDALPVALSTVSKHWRESKFEDCSSKNFYRVRSPSCQPISSTKSTEGTNQWVCRYSILSVALVITKDTLVFWLGPVICILICQCQAPWATLTLQYRHDLHCFQRPHSTHLCKDTVHYNIILSTQTAPSQTTDR